MGFIRATIDYDEIKKMFTASIVSTWLYVGEQIDIHDFDTLSDAKEWILNERCYNLLNITDDARNALSYKDALFFQLNKNKKPLRAIV
jgi:hypothetical protein